ncbi:hypothetical protein ACMT4L_11985 [Deinococcus sp. A31D244]|uniref:hypothetical protein n=1 Tax=Deinococcus sp. A31D244 TaxID=3397675 RepID=UPI0039DF73D7
MTRHDDQHDTTTTDTPQELQAAHPRTWTPAQRRRSRRKAAFLKALQEHGGITAACLASGVNDATVWRWRKQYPAFDRAVIEFVEGVREQRVVESLYRIATSEDPKTATAAAKAGEFLLKVWNPTKYTEKQRIETTITVNAQVQHVHTVRDTLRAKQQERIRELRTIEG